MIRIFITPCCGSWPYSALVLLIEVPLGIGIALCLPRKGWAVGLCLVLLGVPLLIPYNVVGIVWRLFTQSDIGVVPRILSMAGYEYNVSLVPVDAFVTLLLVDVWHWTPLVALLTYAGSAGHPAGLLPGGPGGRRFHLADLSFRDPAQTAARIDPGRAHPVHGFLQNLLGAVALDGWRTREFDDVHESLRCPESRVI